MVKWTNGQMDKWTNKQTNKQTNKLKLVPAVGELVGAAVGAAGVGFSTGGGVLLGAMSLGLGVGGVEVGVISSSESEEP